MILDIVIDLVLMLALVADIALFALNFCSDSAKTLFRCICNQADRLRSASAVSTAMDTAAKQALAAVTDARCAIDDKVAKVHCHGQHCEGIYLIVLSY